MGTKDFNTKRNNFYVLLLLVCLFLLAIAASLVYVIFPRERWSGNAGVLIGLWASALGLIAILFTRRRIVEWQRRVDSLQLFYEVQLDKEVLARAEYEQSLQATVYQSISERYRNDIEALRGELHSLKQNLETLTGGALKESINTLIVASKRLALTSAEGSGSAVNVQDIAEEVILKSHQLSSEVEQSQHAGDITSETHTLPKSTGLVDSRLVERDVTELLKKTPSGKILFSEPSLVQGEAVPTVDPAPKIAEVPNYPIDIFPGESTASIEGIAEAKFLQKEKINSAETLNTTNFSPQKFTSDSDSLAVQPVSTELHLDAFVADSVPFTERTREQQPTETVNESINDFAAEAQPKVGRRHRHEHNGEGSETESLISGRFPRAGSGQHRHGVPTGSHSQNTDALSGRKNFTAPQRSRTNQKISGDISPPVVNPHKDIDVFAPPIEKDAGDEPPISSDITEKNYSTYQPTNTEIEQRKSRRGTGKNITDILAQRPSTASSHRGHRHRGD